MPHGRLFKGARLWEPMELLHVTSVYCRCCELHLSRMIVIRRCCIQVLLRDELLIELVCLKHGTGLLLRGDLTKFCRETSRNFLVSPGAGDLLNS